MSDQPTDEAVLLETLRDAQRLGFFGAAPIEQAMAHARQFVDAIAAGPLPGRVVDIGSGGGLPGLVVADVLRSSVVELIDRREKRTDFLERAVRRLGLSHVRVRCADVAQVARDVERGVAPAADVVTARGFGPPEATLRLASRLLNAGGRIVISEPPTGERWAPELLDELGLLLERAPGVAVFVRPPAR
ncbi:MAG: class I SAM-dependent methyltransferase [Acidimicrobiales bacterium]|nr:class I SAM-dependent methyltransferase [Acidimicrobiales bacterium]